MLGSEQPLGDTGTRLFQKIKEMHRLPTPPPRQKRARPELGAPKYPFVGTAAGGSNTSLARLPTSFRPLVSREKVLCYFGCTDDCLHEHMGLKASDVKALSSGRLLDAL
ncbi:hypothetical protein NDU88_011809 [Pleurodeles waltl]|uniref:Uncharacterized protein n=1 Tax=Pleurodeles waltl TaxID=8319 RepID=A0AAV7QZN7_PLEWA|nr:hypothetical protein NDU88_011809 [Pleurodeles waltl]